MNLPAARCGYLLKFFPSLDGRGLRGRVRKYFHPPPALPRQGGGNKVTPVAKLRGISRLKGASRPPFFALFSASPQACCSSALFMVEISYESLKGATHGRRNNRHHMPGLPDRIQEKGPRPHGRSSHKMPEVRRIDHDKGRHVHRDGQEPRKRRQRLNRRRAPTGNGARHFLPSNLRSFQFFRMMKLCS